MMLSASSWAFETRPHDLLQDRCISSGPAMITDGWNF
jgi:hypothetical protein